MHFLLDKGYFMLACRLIQNHPDLQKMNSTLIAHPAVRISPRPKPY